MFRGREIEAGWTALFGALALAGLLMSRGEPVCEGPFIQYVLLSDPPQCGSPVDFLPVVGAVWAAGLLLIVGLRLLARRLRRD